LIFCQTFINKIIFNVDKKNAPSVTLHVTRQTLFGITRALCRGMLWRQTLFGIPRALCRGMLWEPFFTQVGKLHTRSPASGMTLFYSTQKSLTPPHSLHMLSNTLPISLTNWFNLHL